MLESFTGLSQYTDSYMLRIIGTLYVCEPLGWSDVVRCSWFSLAAYWTFNSYLVSFMCLFAYVFLMALIAINEEAFFASRCVSAQLLACTASPCATCIRLRVCVCVCV